MSLESNTNHQTPQNTQKSTRTSEYWRVCWGRTAFRCFAAPPCMTAVKRMERNMKSNRIAGFPKVPHRIPQGSPGSQGFPRVPRVPARVPQGSPGSPPGYPWVPQGYSSRNLGTAVAEGYLRSQRLLKVTSAASGWGGGWGGVGWGVVVGGVVVVWGWGGVGWGCGGGCSEQGKLRGNRKSHNPNQTIHQIRNTTIS